MLIGQNKNDKFSCSSISEFEKVFEIYCGTSHEEIGHVLSQERRLGSNAFIKAS